ncbi:MAG: class I SAM-dependent methyltransferase [bacterium]|nr:class I SAM-dependent methyltransferase [bacterium]
MTVLNSYEDTKMADAYAKLRFPGTYYLAFRDLAEIISQHSKGKSAIDFGCGAGRSTRFLQKIGFNTVGVDISGDMIRNAAQSDPDGDYRLINDGDFSQFEKSSVDLVLSAFTFDNIDVKKRMIHISKTFSRLLKNDGVFVSLVSTPEMYTNEWASFSTKDFIQNKKAGSGDIVKVINTEIEDKTPVNDILKTHEDYREIFDEAGMDIVATYKPLAKESEPYEWVNETKIAPWIIYVVKKKTA